MRSRLLALFVAAACAGLAGDAAAQSKVTTFTAPTSGWCKLNAPSDTVAFPPRPVEGAAMVTDAPFTVAPKLVNRDVVTRAIDRTYRREWREGGIPYEVVLWVLVDRNGAVPDVFVGTSSGRPEVDEAAKGVGCVMEFIPARTLDGAVAAWISMPISFR